MGTRWAYILRQPSLRCAKKTEVTSKRPDPGGRGLIALDNYCYNAIIGRGGGVFLSTPRVILKYLPNGLS